MNAEEYRDTLEFLAQTPQRVADLVAGFDGEAQRLRPAADAFSALEQVCHLRDVEREGYAIRVNRVLEESNPQLEGIDGSRLALDRDYQSQNLAAALTAFEAARRASLQVLQNAATAERERQCGLEGTTGLTLADLARLMREHDAGHLKELEALRGQLLQAQEAAAVKIL